MDTPPPPFHSSDWMAMTPEDDGRCVELHQLDLKYASLRAIDERRRRQLLASLAQHGQRAPVLLVATNPIEGAVNWLAGAATGDLGRSWVDGAPVRDVLIEAAGVSASLAGAASR